MVQHEYTHTCGEPLHFHQIHGIRLTRIIGGRTVYDAYCPKCREYFQCDSEGNELQERPHDND